MASTRDEQLTALAAELHGRGWYVQIDAEWPPRPCGDAIVAVTLGPQRDSRQRWTRSESRQWEAQHRRLSADAALAELQQALRRPVPPVMRREQAQQEAGRQDATGQERPPG